MIPYPQNQTLNLGCGDKWTQCVDWVEHTSSSIQQHQDACTCDLSGWIDPERPFDTKSRGERLMTTYSSPCTCHQINPLFSFPLPVRARSGFLKNCGGGLRLCAGSTEGEDWG